MSSVTPPAALPRPPASGRVVAGRHGTYRVDTRVLAHGGRAVLHEVADGPIPLVYKLFKEPLQDSGARHRLGRLVAEGRRQFITSRNRLGCGPGSALDWPVDLVIEAERVVGVILPRVPATYQRANGSLRNMEFLLLHRGEVPTAAQRVTILIRLAELLAWLSRRRLVHGDIAPRNLIWTTQPGPEVVVLDVDGIHDDMTAASEHVATPGWTDPRVLERITGKHDIQSDWYALALFVYRGLLVTPGMLRKGPNGWPGPTLPPSFFPRVRSLLVRALADPLHGARPAPDEWVAALYAEFFTSGTPNWPAFEMLDRYVAAREAQDRRVSGRITPSPDAPAAPVRRSWWRKG
jgi:hypothetical protein